MVIQCKNLISLYILPDQRRVNLRFFDFDQNRLWGATSLYLFSFSLHFTRSTTGKSIFIFLLFTFYPINDGWKSAYTDVAFLSYTRATPGTSASQ